MSTHDVVDAVLLCQLRDGTIREAKLSVADVKALVIKAANMQPGGVLLLNEPPLDGITFNRKP